MKRLLQVLLAAAPLVLAAGPAMGQAPPAADEFDCVYDAMSPELRQAFFDADNERDMRDAGSQIGELAAACYTRHHWTSDQAKVAAFHAMARTQLEMTLARLPPSVSAALDASFATLSDEQVGRIRMISGKEDGPGDDEAERIVWDSLGPRLAADGATEENKELVVGYLAARAEVRVSTEQWNVLVGQDEQ